MPPNNKENSNTLSPCIQEKLDEYGLSPELKVGSFTAVEAICRLLELSSYPNKQAEVAFMDEALKELQAGLSSETRKQLVKVIKSCRLIPYYNRDQLLEKNDEKQLSANDILAMFNLLPSDRVGNYSVVALANKLVEHLNFPEKKSVFTRIDTLIDSLYHLRPITGLGYIMNDDLTIKEEHSDLLREIKGGNLNPVVSDHSSKNPDKIKRYHGYTVDDLKRLAELMGPDRLAFIRYISSGSSSAIKDTLIRHGFCNEDGEPLLDPEQITRRINEYFFSTLEFKDEESRQPTFILAKALHRFREWLGK